MAVRIKLGGRVSLLQWRRLIALKSSSFLQSVDSEDPNSAESITRQLISMLGAMTTPETLLGIANLLPATLDFAHAFQELTTDLATFGSIDGDRRRAVLVSDALRQCLQPATDIACAALVNPPGSVSENADSDSILEVFDHDEARIELVDFGDRDERKSTKEKIKEVANVYFEKQDPPGDDVRSWTIHDDEGVQGFLADFSNEGERICIGIFLFNEPLLPARVTSLRLAYHVLWFSAWLLLRADRYNSQERGVTKVTQHLSAHLGDFLPPTMSNELSPPFDDAGQVLEDLRGQISAFGNMATAKIAELFGVEVVRLYTHEPSASLAWCIGAHNSMSYRAPTEKLRSVDGSTSEVSLASSILRSLDFFGIDVFALATTPRDAIDAADQKCRSARLDHNLVTYEMGRLFGKSWGNLRIDQALATIHIETESLVRARRGPLLVFTDRPHPNSKPTPGVPSEDFVLELLGRSSSDRWIDIRGTVSTHVNRKQRVQHVLNYTGMCIRRIMEAWLREWSWIVRIKLETDFRGVRLGGNHGKENALNRLCDDLASAFNTSTVSLFHLAGEREEAGPGLRRGFRLLAWSRKSDPPASFSSFDESLSTSGFVEWTPSLDLGPEEPSNGVSYVVVDDQKAIPLLLHFSGIRSLFSGIVPNSKGATPPVAPPHVTMLLNDAMRPLRELVSYSAREWVESTSAWPVEDLQAQLLLWAERYSAATEFGPALGSKRDRIKSELRPVVQKVRSSGLVPPRLVMKKTGSKKSERLSEED